MEGSHCSVLKDPHLRSLGLFSLQKILSLLIFRGPVAGLILRNSRGVREPRRTRGSLWGVKEKKRERERERESDWREDNEEESPRTCTRAPPRTYVRSGNVRDVPAGRITKLISRPLNSTSDRKIHPFRRMLLFASVTSPLLPSEAWRQHPQDILSYFYGRNIFLYSLSQQYFRHKFRKSVFY
jgi:hypothetical protein